MVDPSYMPPSRGHSPEPAPLPRTNSVATTSYSTKTCTFLRDCCSTVRWYLHFSDNTAFIMIGLFILGTTFALGHHVLYLCIDGKEVPTNGTQQYALQGGTAFALLARSCFSGAITTAQMQWVWYTFGRRSFSVKGMDAMFGLTRDLTRIFSWEMIKKAKVATCLGLLAWSMPISIVFTPSALLVEIDRDSLSTETPRLKYHYQPKNIYIGYGVIILVSIIAIGLGCIAYHRSTVTSQAFSSLFKATRNPELDRIAWDRVTLDDLSEIRLTLKPGEMDEMAGVTKRTSFRLSDASFTGRFPLRAVVRYG